MKFKEYLNESFDVKKQDIDYIYSFLTPTIKEWNSNIESDIVERMIKLQDDLKNNFILKRIKTSVLKSDIIKVVDKINPMEIQIGFVTPTYNLFNKTIVVGADSHLLFKASHGEKREKIKENLVKASIRHEITHWLDDTLNNFYMTKIYKTQDWDTITRSGDGEIESTDFEVIAQVDAVKEVIRRFPKITKSLLSFDVIVKIMKWEHKVKLHNWVTKMKSALKKEKVI